ncbi:NADH-quinone oxidoreductase subunit L [Thiobacter aerophilum]|uniref:Probable inorganic carbon transporter subunit DabB n=1 Tax=Thiobacter aerophilum TaxID=3121275 RepID=A0ABV0EIB6_9BURK
MTTLVPALVLMAPSLIFLAGLLSPRWRDARLAAQLGAAAAWVAFGCAVMVALGHALAPASVWTLAALGLPANIGSFSLSVQVNGVTVIMLLLVSFVGAIVSHYARNYLDGDAQQARFHRWLAYTLASILTLIVSGNLLMFSLAWIATSLGLHQLLMFYRERPAAVLAAHKKFIASRIGDVSLLIAIVLIGSTLHTLEFGELYARMAAWQGPLPATLEAAALLIVFSAGLKSAQFPLHGWLIQVMEAPTPVSALLHAGIVNAGAFLVIRMSPIVSHSGTALAVLAIVGLITLSLASLVMLTQTSIKVSLAWSTTAQMGFMLLECGLGLYSLAMLHLVAHSLYKAHAFLASGSGVDGFRAPALAWPQHEWRPGWLLLALVMGATVTAAMAALFAVSWQAQPALMAAGAIVAIAVAQLQLQTMTALGVPSMGYALALSGVVAGAYFLLHALFERMVGGSVLPLVPAVTAVQSALIVPVVIVFLLLMLFQHGLTATGSRMREALWVHLYNGLYIDVFVTRLLQRVWPAPNTIAQGVGK